MRKGYSLDGATSSVAARVANSFDWLSKQNGEIHMRVGGLTSAGNDGKLQYRYVASDGTVTWRDLTTGLTTIAYNFTTWWNSTESLRECLFVNGTSNIFAWNGATAVIASTTATTITKTGTDSWLDAGFYSVGNKSIVINGTTYTYTGGESTTTLTGVSGDPTGEADGSIVHQAVVTTANSTMTGITSTFTNGLIATMNNQIFLGSLTSSVMWLSKVNSYTDYSSSTTRQQGEGGSLVLDANLVAFNVQGDQTTSTMYVSAGKDIWYKITFTTFVSVVGASGETLGAVPIKSGKRQGAISQAFVSNMKNNVISVTNETTIDLMGVMENYLTQIQVQNISDPIKLDIDSYDFTNGSIFYFRYYIYVAIPAEGIVRVFNIATKSWEAPQTLPISRFYIVDGELYGHSYNTFESYKLFTGYADRVYTGFSGFPISAVAKFSYQNYGSRSTYKKANYLYVEGYITANTSLTANVNYELDGCMTSRTLPISGKASYVCLPTETGSLGKVSLGKSKLGGADTASINGLPPKFRVELSFNNKNFFEQSTQFSCLGVNQRFEILAFGLNASQASEEPVKNRA